MVDEKKTTTGGINMEDHNEPTSGSVSNTTGILHASPGNAGLKILAANEATMSERDKREHRESCDELVGISIHDISLSVSDCDINASDVGGKIVKVVPLKHGNEGKIIGETIQIHSGGIVFYSSQDDVSIPTATLVRSLQPKGANQRKNNSGDRSCLMSSIPCSDNESEISDSYADILNPVTKEFGMAVASSPPFLNRNVKTGTKTGAEDLRLGKSFKKLHQPKQLYPFELCSQVFERPSQLASHIRLHKEDQPFKCGECNRLFTNEHNLLAHSKRHKRKSQFECKICYKKYGRMDILTKHEKTHTGEKLFVCMECGKSFADSRTLSTHVKIHFGGKKFQCGECGRCFSQKCNLKTHMITHTGQKPHICSQCGEGFTQVSNLKTHMALHSGEKPFACLECGKCFALSSYLKCHMDIHSAERPFKCNMCQKAFKTRRTLRSHVKTHRLNKRHARYPYKCPLCDKCFVLESNMENHIKFHYGEKPYKCEDCGRTFTEKWNLKAHMRIHRGIRDHVCAICGKGFIQLGILKKHYAIHSSQKSYECKTCGVKFSRPGNLKFHQKVHKTEEEVKRIEALIEETRKSNALKHNFASSLLKQCSSIPYKTEPPGCEDPADVPEFKIQSIKNIALKHSVDLKVFATRPEADDGYHRQNLPRTKVVQPKSRPIWKLSVVVPCKKLAKTSNEK